MAQQTINIGSAANDGTGDPLRTAFDKINDNFTEIYGSTAEANDLLEDSSPQLGGDLRGGGRSGRKMRYSKRNLSSHGYKIMCDDRF